MAVGRRSFGGEELSVLRGFFGGDTPRLRRKIRIRDK